MKRKLVALSALLILIYSAMGYSALEEVKAIQHETPLYFDWGFWQSFAAFAALIISLAPYVAKLIKSPRISVHMMNRISVHHTLGNPNVTLFLIIENTGGAAARIRSITLKLCKGNKEYTIPARSYYPDASDRKMAVLAPFNLLPGHDWSHGVYFYPDFSREEDIAFRTLTGNMKTNIQAKIPLVPPVAAPNTTPVLHEADPHCLQPAMQFFEAHFMWSTGEYSGTITIQTEPNKATTSKAFRFTLFETESNELRNYSADYKYGLGVYYYNLDRHPGISVVISEN